VQTKDSLEAFILEGFGRSVDAWVAEHVLGWTPETKYLPWCDADGEAVFPLPEFHTDRGLRHVIEDRVAEVIDPDEYTEELSEILIELFDYVGWWQFIRATNRQVILAASRAMNLETPDGK